MILEFSQELVKICAAANNLDLRVYTTSWYSMGGTPSIKAEQAGLCSHLGFT